MSSAEQPLNTREHAFYELVADLLESKREVRESVRLRLAADFPEYAREIQEFWQGQCELDRLIQPMISLTGAQHDTESAAEADSVRLRKSLPEFSDFEILEEIARGGMGIVYKARHKSLGRYVALKMIRSAELATEEDVRRLREEAQRVALLDHPGIVPVYQVGTERENHYFTMRLMEGGSLADRMNGRPFSAQQSAAIIVQMARAVHFAHQRGILHRDIKPGNILFDAEGCPHIGDFGLARQIGPDLSVPQSMAIVGTPLYMAPEQAKREGGLTTAVDIYSLGTVLYEMLTGKPPFREQNPLDTLLAVARRDPARPRSIEPKIDVDLETICLKCLEKEPARRYGSAESLADDLERWLRNEPILARRGSLWRRTVKWAKRSPAVAAMSLLSAAAVAISIAALVASNAAITDEAMQKSKALDERTQALRERTQALDDLQTLRDRERHFAYFQSISLAERELAVGNVARAEQILEKCPAAFRSWEWWYLRRLCHAERASLQLDNEPTCLAYDPTQDRVVVGNGILGQPGEISVFDASLKTNPQQLGRHENSVTALAIRRDGTRIASASGSTIRVCRFDQGELIAEFSKHQGSVHSLAFTADGQHVVSAGDDATIRIWDAETGNESLVLVGHRGTVWSVACSSDGRRIASAGADRTVKLWDARTGECLRTLTGHQGLVRGVTFSSDGRRLVSAAYDNTARIWDAETGAELLQLIGHTGFVTRAVFSPDDQRVATSSVDGTLRVWDAESGELSLLLRGHATAVWDVTWCRDGKQLVSIGEGGDIKLWNGTAHGLPRALNDRSRWMHRLDSSADGSRVATFYPDGVLEIWNTATDTKIGAIPGYYDDKVPLVFSGDGKFVAAARRPNLIVRNTDDTSVMCEVPLSKSSLIAMAMNRDGRFLAIMEREDIRVWDVSRKTELHRFPHTALDNAYLAFNDRGNLLAVALRDEEQKHNRVTVWNVERGEVITNLASQGMRLRFTPDGESLAVFGNSSVVEVWNATTGAQTLVVDRRRATVKAVAFAPAGDRLFAADDEGTVTLWDTRTGNEVLALRDVPVAINHLGFLEEHTLLGLSSTGSGRRWSGEPVSETAQAGLAQ